MNDLIHVEDLTKNTTRFDMLDYYTRRRLKELPADEREWWDGEKWLSDAARSPLYGATTYRHKPKPETVVSYRAVYETGVSGSWRSLPAAKRDCPDALSFLRIETCIKTGRIISAENVEVGNE